MLTADTPVLHPSHLGHLLLDSLLVVSVFLLPMD